LWVQVFGFRCSCPRCLLEATPEWQQQQEEEEEEGENGDGLNDDSDDSGDQRATDEEADTETAVGCAAATGTAEVRMQDACQAWSDGTVGSSNNHHQQQQQQALEPAYLSLFLLKYMCPREGCFGTMAGVHGSSAGTCECCVCGTTRDEAEFMAELEQQ
jgi:SET and MYND domain-containing protein